VAPVPACWLFKTSATSWPFDLETGVQVTCDVGYLCANFSLPKPLCSRLRTDVRDRQTSDVRQHHRSMPPGRGVIRNDNNKWKHGSDTHSQVARRQQQAADQLTMRFILLHLTADLWHPWLDACRWHLTRQNPVSRVVSGVVLLNVRSCEPNAGNVKINTHRQVRTHQFLAPRQSWNSFFCVLDAKKLSKTIDAKSVLLLRPWSYRKSKTDYGNWPCQPASVWNVCTVTI